MQKSKTSQFLSQLDEIFSNEKLKTKEEIYEDVQSLVLKFYEHEIEQITISSEISNSSFFDFVYHSSYSDENLTIGIKRAATENSSDFYELLIDSINIRCQKLNQLNVLNSIIKKSVESSKEKDDFFANMSHELRIPLNAINGFSQILLLRNDTPEKIKSYISKISTAGLNLLEQVNTILDFAKLESGKMTYTPTLSDIGNILLEAKTLTASQAKEKNIEINLPQVESLNLYLDRKLFKQVLLNLISNAIKFSHENGKIELNVQFDDDTNSYIFSVCDNGIGIAEDKIEHIFEPYAQVGNRFGANHKGTGLRLSISKKIIQELHGGDIWCKSKENEGSCFYISIPVLHQEPQTIVNTNSADGNIKVLIVEESEIYQRVLSQKLKPTCCISITDSVCGAELLLNDKNYDVVLLDFFLSDGTGSEVLEYMLINEINIPTIVISMQEDDYINDMLPEYSNLIDIINKNDIDLIEAKIIESKIL